MSYRLHVVDEGVRLRCHVYERIGEHVRGSIVSFPATDDVSD
jgi:hypothetical protein